MRACVPDGLAGRHLRRRTSLEPVFLPPRIMPAEFVIVSPVTFVFKMLHNSTWACLEQSEETAVDAAAAVIDQPIMPDQLHRESRLLGL